MESQYKVYGYLLDRRPPGERTKRGYRKMQAALEISAEDPLEALQQAERLLRTFSRRERLEIYRLEIERARDANEILSLAAGEGENESSGNSTTEQADEAEEAEQDE